MEPDDDAIDADPENREYNYSCNIYFFFILILFLNFLDMVVDIQMI